MGQNREQLNKLLIFIEALSKQNGNEWFVDELRSRFASTNNLSLMKVEDIYELCVEDIIRKQAEQFYEKFPIPNLSAQLIEDFIRMEHFRRKDNFEDFCLAMYQQIELITNTIADNAMFNDVVYNMMGYPAYIQNKKIDDRPGEYQIATLLFMNDAILKGGSLVKDHYAIDKIKCILYFICYNACMESNDFKSYTDTVEIMSELYQYRNTNHRGGTPNEYQSKVYKKIDPIKNIYFLKFMGAFSLFIEKVTLGYPLSKDLINYAMNISPIKIKLPGVKEIGRIDPSKISKK